MPGGKARVKLSTVIDNWIDRNICTRMEPVMLGVRK
jgi:hypothetical protein